MGPIAESDAVVENLSLLIPHLLGGLGGKEIMDAEFSPFGEHGLKVDAVGEVVYFVDDDKELLTPLLPAERCEIDL